jgi:hypothetical protein
MSRREHTMEEANLRHQMAGKSLFSSGLSPEPLLVTLGLPDMGVGNQPLAKDGGTGLWTPTEPLSQGPAAGTAHATGGTHFHECS